MNISAPVLLLFVCFAIPAVATVVVKSPSDGQTVSSPAVYSATATTTTCSRGVASMGIYVDNQLVYVVNGTILNTALPINSGRHNTVVEEWDYCGGATFIPVALTVTSQSGVHLVSPASNSTVNSPATYVATATSSCPKGVASMGIYVNNQLVHVENGASLNTQLKLDAGTQHTVVEEWDFCGGASYTPVDVTIQSAGKVLSNLQATGGWNSWGEFAPKYDITSTQGPGVNWSMLQHIKSPSLSGNATRFNIGGSVPYSDVLWSNPVIGQNTTQDIPDTGHTLLPALHNFTYDADFYVTNDSITQVLEFDINMYMNGAGMIWGTQCNILGGKVWEIWDNAGAKWVPTGSECIVRSNAWNHVTILAQRESDNTILYQSVTLNGKTANINKTYLPFSVPIGWWGITLNYQMDGDYKQSANLTYLDNLNFSYW